MQKGDRVWARVSRDKERPAIYLTEDSGYIIVKDPLTKQEIAFEPSEIRPMIEGSASLGVVAIKHDTEKVRLELIPVSGIEGIGRAMTFGATKYSAHNWAKGFDYSRLIGSAMRHLNAWSQGQDKDPESGLSHLDHLGACVTMLIAHEVEGLGNDDRRKTDT